MEGLPAETVGDRDDTTASAVVRRVSRRDGKRAQRAGSKNSLARSAAVLNLG
jgi:hypothetical protein